MRDGWYAAVDLDGTPVILRAPRAPRLGPDGVWRVTRAGREGSFSRRGAPVSTPMEGDPLFAALFPRLRRGQCARIARPRRLRARGAWTGATRQLPSKVDARWLALAALFREGPLTRKLLRK